MTLSITQLAQLRAKGIWVRIEYAAARLSHARMDPLTADKIRELRNPPVDDIKRKPRSAMEMM